MEKSAEQSSKGVPGSSQCQPPPADITDEMMDAACANLKGRKLGGEDVEELILPQIDCAYGLIEAPGGNLELGMWLSPALRKLDSSIAGDLTTGLTMDMRNSFPHGSRSYVSTPKWVEGGPAVYAVVIATIQQNERGRGFFICHDPDFIGEADALTLFKTRFASYFPKMSKKLHTVQMKVPHIS